MSIADYRLVQKPFNLDNAEKLRPNQVVDVSGWRNSKGLEGARYLRRPVTEDDYALIKAFMEQAEEPITEQEQEQEPEQEPAPRRGRPPKNGGE